MELLTSSCTIGCNACHGIGSTGGLNRLELSGNRVTYFTSDFFFSLTSSFALHIGMCCISWHCEHGVIESLGTEWEWSYLQPVHWDVMHIIAAKRD